MMGRRSKFETLDPELLADVHRLIRAGKTIREIREHLANLGEPVSNGATARFVGRTRAQLKRYQDAQQVAGAWVTELNEKPRGDVSVMLAELLKTIAHHTMDSMAGGEDGPAKPAKAMDIMLLAKAIQSLESTAKQSMDRRERIEKAILERQVKAVEKTVRAAGVSDEGWERIRSKFLGLDQVAQA